MFIQASVALRRAHVLLVAGSVVVVASIAALVAIAVVVTVLGWVPPGRGLVVTGPCGVANRVPVIKS